jgi:predicted nucleic acid-binding protein
LIVVFDSNVWISELGLRSGIAAATKFFLSHNRARLAVPEVVRLEVEQELQARLTEHIDSIQLSYRQLLTAFGKLREVVLPTKVEVLAKIQELFDSIEVEKVDVPFSIESARSSFLKTINKSPPSDKRQEFKDGVLWADCLGLLASDAVVLVTSDKAFYKDREYAKGLAANLEAEARQRPNPLTIVPTLSALLQSLRTTVTLDEDKLAQVFLEQYKESVGGTLQRVGFELGARQSLEYTLFATETPTVLFLEFFMAYSCRDIRDEGRTDAVLFLKGDGSYMPTTGRFSELRNFGEHLKYRMPDGSERENRSAVIYAAGLVMGHKEVTNVVRYKLDDGR